ncbi:cellulose synthase A catalytic subunit 5 [UDP-forming]-like [Olea europaea subsp. europaea]|uniref:Cellulose synthase A catalytic subunit 5 [UDP-forming]-like n=1 Tax=Olea europaea subsp. europaea TaxID=158383 RepID=A0A8S0VLU6_OLEEU|nr:cellulose synthase A catalytic subunit 5 [UDP-forming]-like [Olea europaea subsp. europaea]
MLVNDGNEDEDEFDDLENEFDYNSNERRETQQIAAASLSAHLDIGRSASGITTPSELDSSAIALEISLLTYGQEKYTSLTEDFAISVEIVSGDFYIKMA